MSLFTSTEWLLLDARAAMIDRSMVTRPGTFVLQRECFCRLRYPPSFALGMQALHHSPAQWCEALEAAAAERSLRREYINLYVTLEQGLAFERATQNPKTGLLSKFAVESNVPHSDLTYPAISADGRTETYRIPENPAYWYAR